jgi:hypothetical protein
MVRAKTGSSKARHLPVIYCRVGRFFVDEGITSCKSPIKNWNARDCQNYSVKTTSRDPLRTA